MQLALIWCFFWQSALPFFAFNMPMYCVCGRPNLATPSLAVWAAGGHRIAGTDEYSRPIERLRISVYIGIFYIYITCIQTCPNIFFLFFSGWQMQFTMDVGSCDARVSHSGKMAPERLELFLLEPVAWLAQLAWLASGGGLGSLKLGCDSYSDTRSHTNCACIDAHIDVQEWMSSAIVVK